MKVNRIYTATPLAQWKRDRDSRDVQRAARAEAHRRYPQAQAGSGLADRSRHLQLACDGDTPTLLRYPDATDNATPLTTPTGVLEAITAVTAKAPKAIRPDANGDSNFSGFIRKFFMTRMFVTGR